LDFAKAIATALKCFIIDFGGHRKEKKLTRRNYNLKNFFAVNIF
jgi:hypothetical protein